MKSPVPIYLIIVACLLPRCKAPVVVDLVDQWSVYEVTLSTEKSYENAYANVDVWIEFAGSDGSSLVRPAFYDG